MPARRRSSSCGAPAFLFSTVAVTLLGEIVPQAYFSRHATAMTSLLMPWLAVYRVLLYPVAKPVAMTIDWWLGPEGLRYFRERHLSEMIRKHIEADDAEIDWVEGPGAVKFLAIDDVPVIQEGERLDPPSVIEMETVGRLPAIPGIERSGDDPFLRRAQASGRKWVILTDRSGQPTHVLDANGFLRGALLGGDRFDPLTYCHRPIVVTDPATPLSPILPRLTVVPAYPGDSVIGRDPFLLWGETRRVITGADILGRLLSGLTEVEAQPGAPA